MCIFSALFQKKQTVQTLSTSKHDPYVLLKLCMFYPIDHMCTMSKHGVSQRMPTHTQGINCHQEDSAIATMLHTTAPWNVTAAVK